jgi:hypothetical protein
MGWLSFLTHEAPRDRCGTCRHFRNDPAYIEQAFAGLTSFGSGHASVRADDGLCAEHDLYLSANSTCPRYIATAAELSIR